MMLIRQLTSLVISSVCLWITTIDGKCIEDSVPPPLDIPAPITKAALNAPLAIARIKAGNLTPEEAWQQGLLDEEDLLFLLSQEGGDRGSLNLVDTSGLGAALIELLVEHYPQQVLQPERLNSGVRFRLAEFYFKQHDARAAHLFEGLLAEAKIEVENNKNALPWYYPMVVTLLGEHYQKTQQYPKAINLFQEALVLSGHPNYAPDWVLKIARTYLLMNNEQKALEYYVQVSKYNNGWFKGVALTDQAHLLMRKGRYSDACTLLQQAVTGNGAEQIQVDLDSVLAYSYYRSGDFESARRYCLRAIDRYKGLASPSPNVDPVTDHKLLELMNLWAKKPMICTPQEIYIVVGQQEKQNSIITRRLSIRSPRVFPLAITTDAPRLKANLISEVSPGSHDYYVEQELLVQVDTKSTENFDGVVAIRSPKLPAFEIQVPVHVQIQKPIQLSIPSIFFGFIKAHETSSKTLQLSSAVPFHIIKFESNNPLFEVSFKPIGTAATEYAVALKFSPQVSGQVHTGDIQIATDLSNQEVIRIPYFAAVQ